MGESLGGTIMLKRLMHLEFWPCFITTGILSILLNGYLIFYYGWMLTSSIGSVGLFDILGLFSILLFFPIMSSFPTALIGLVLVFFKEYRKPAITLFACSTVLLCLSILILTGGMIQNMRHSAFVKLEQRSKPLVKAIEQFNKDNNHPPKDLNELCPKYISQIPSTGMNAYPTYQYEVNTSKTDWEGNPWVLYINTPNGMINFDRFIYLPNQNYPESIQGERLEKIGSWAYLHE